MGEAKLKIGLGGPFQAGAAGDLVRLLRAAFPGLFEPLTDVPPGALGGVVQFAARPEESPPACGGVPCLVVHLATGTFAAPRLCFGHGSAVPRVFRGRTVGLPRAACLAPQVSAGGGEVLATVEGRPTWMDRSEPGRRVEHCAVDLRDAGTATALFQCLAAGGVAQLLPILEMVRRVLGRTEWTPPPIRANLMFDDPNLHAANYGHLNFAALVRSAEAHDYHASFATVPVDTWYTSRKAAALFRDFPHRLSLLIHGHYHRFEEMARFPTPQVALREMGQALNRIRRFEQRSGVAVARVTAAPHGVCSELTLQAMARLGYEGAAISNHYLKERNPGALWVPAVGADMAVFAGGTPVVPRFRISRDYQANVLLAAYLDQPIIPAGHHGDFADDFGLVQEVAGFINGLGPVRWTGMKDIFRANFYRRRRGSELHLRAFARVLELTLPPDVTSLSVEPAWSGDSRMAGLRVGQAGVAEQRWDHYAGEAFPVRGGTRLHLEFPVPDPVDPATQRGRLQVLGLARRQVCELRDRLRLPPS